MQRPSPRLEGVPTQLATKRRMPDGSVWLNQYRVCEKLASSEASQPVNGPHRDSSAAVLGRGAARERERPAAAVVLLCSRQSHRIYIYIYLGVCCL